MASAAILTVLLSVASYFDVRWRRIPNRLTYSGLLLGLALSGLATAAGLDREADDSPAVRRLGVVSLSDSLSGCLACGGIMLAGYVLFPGAIGGGDLKLLAMTGAFLGVQAGLEALLWTMVLSGCLALIVLIWQAGAVALTLAVLRAIGAVLRGRRPTIADWPVMKTDLFLSPSALAAALLVIANEHLHWW